MYFFFLWTCFRFSGNRTRMEFLGYMITLCLIFCGNARFFSQMLMPFYIFISNIWGPYFLTLIMVWLSDLNYPGIEKSSISCFFFICIFLITSDVNHLFMHLLGICSLTSVYVLLHSKIAFSTIYFMKYFTGLFIPLHPVFCSFLILLASYIYR